MEERRYDLCIDEGTQVTRLMGNDGLSRIEADTKIVMRVVIQRWTTSFEARYQCRFCGTWNDEIALRLQEWTGLSIGWWVCISSGSLRR
jgi:hypothetical protein